MARSISFTARRRILHGDQVASPVKRSGCRLDCLVQAYGHSQSRPLLYGSVSIHHLHASGRQRE